jgi:hypothetical protein
MRTLVVLTAVALCVLLSSCHKWVSLDRPTTQAIDEQPSATIRVTLADSSRKVLTLPRVRGDSLIAFEDTLAVALDDVRKVEVRRTDVLATVGLATGITVASLFGFALAVCLLGACAGT